MAKYDVIVVGAGNGGIASALECALEGKKVLIIEKNFFPGGAASSFVRGRFEIETSLHALCNYGSKDNPGAIRELMEHFGVRVELIHFTDSFRLIGKYSDGTKMDVTFPWGVTPFISKMEMYVPGCRSKMKDFFELLQEIADGSSYVASKNGKVDEKFMKKTFPNMLKTGTYSTKRILRALKLPSKCIDIISCYWSFLGQDLDHVQFFHFANMVHNYVTRGAHIALNTSADFSNSLIEKFLSLGGTIYYNCLAKEFLYKDGRCTGVVTSNGIYEAQYVIANINHDFAYGKMSKSNEIPTYLKKLSAVRNHKYLGRMICAYFCLDASIEELGIKDYLTIFQDVSDPTLQLDNIMIGLDFHSYAMMTCHNVLNPNASPKGTCILNLVTYASFNEWKSLADDDYYSFKNKIANKFIKLIKAKANIDIENHIEELEVATPYTFAHFLGTPDGASFGYEINDWDGVIARSLSLNADEIIPGLKLVGASNERGAGFGSCLVQGFLTAKRVLKELNKGEK